MKGIAGVGRKKKAILARSVKEGCKQNCRLDCHSKLKKNHRDAAFASYWNLKSKQDKWNCICNWVECTPLVSPTNGNSDDESKKDSKKYAKQ